MSSKPQDWYKEHWGGRTFECLETSIRLVIPDCVDETDFFTFGNCFVDVGRGDGYCRFGGRQREIGTKGEDKGGYQD